MCTNKNLFDSLSDSIQQNSSMAFLMWNSTSSVFSADFHRCLIIKLWCVSIRVSNGRHKTGLPVNIVGDLAIGNPFNGKHNIFLWFAQENKKMKKIQKTTVMRRPSANHTLYSPSTRPEWRGSILFSLFYPAIESHLDCPRQLLRLESRRSHCLHPPAPRCPHSRGLWTGTDRIIRIKKLCGKKNWSTEYLVVNVNNN